MQERIIKLCKEKGFPMKKKDIDFLIRRIEQELLECKEDVVKKDYEHLKEELIDVLIQTVQAISAIGGNVEELFNTKMNKNFKRKWDVEEVESR